MKNPFKTFVAGIVLGVTVILTTAQMDIPNPSALGLYRGQVYYSMFGQQFLTNANPSEAIAMMFVNTNIPGGLITNGQQNVNLPGGTFPNGAFSGNGTALSLPPQAITNGAVNQMLFSNTTPSAVPYRVEGTNGDSLSYVHQYLGAEDFWGSYDTNNDSFGRDASNGDNYITAHRGNIFTGQSNVFNGSVTAPSVSGNLTGNVLGSSTTSTNIAVGTNLIGDTTLFYGSFANFSSVNNGFTRGMNYIAVSQYANTNWNLIEPNPCYVDPDFGATNVAGPSLGQGGGVTEYNGCLYMVYSRVLPGFSPPATTHVAGQLAVASSTDLTNWTLIGTWTAPDSLSQSNAFYDSPNWSQVNYGGTNWICFGLNTNQNVQAGAGVLSLLPVTLTPTNATFGVVVPICTNMPTAAGMAGSYTIVSNSNPTANGTIIYIIPYATQNGNHPIYSTNFLGPYTNTATWTMPPINTDFSPWLLSVSNNSAWYWWANANIEVSVNFGTNWTVLSPNGLGPLNPVFQQSQNNFQWGIATKPEGIFRLTTPLTNQTANVIQSGDGHFTGTVTADNLDALTVHASAGVFTSLSVSGPVQGTARQPFTLIDGFDSGPQDTNYGFFNVVIGQNVIAGPDTEGSIFLGQGYGSDDAPGNAVFEFEDGSQSVPNPLGGLGASSGGFYVNAGQIIFAQAPVNSQAGYEANGTAGLTQNLNIQTNSVGPHGMTLEFKNGLYVGEAPY